MFCEYFSQLYQLFTATFLAGTLALTFLPCLQIPKPMETGKRQRKTDDGGAGSRLRPFLYGGVNENNMLNIETFICRFKKNRSFQVCRDGL